MTRGCSWNKCIFCNSYKKEKFKVRKIEEIINDLETIFFYKDNFKETYFHEQVKRWKNFSRIFIGDTDIFKSDLISILKLIKNKFPMIYNFSAYSSIYEIFKTTKETFQELNKLGLDRLYIGLETGNKEVLKLINKEYSFKHITDSIGKTNNIETYYHYVIGLGGKQLSYKHAIDSAKLLNKINPTCVELRTIQVYENTRLNGMKKNNEWIEMSDREKKKELDIFLKIFKGKVFNNHSSNNWLNN